MNGQVLTQAVPLKIKFPEDLPVSARRDEIAAAMQAHQVIIVCGETGSGKTTQLPKIALQLGRGRVNGGRLIGHTQPRRIAASSVARRIAEELKTPLGEVVGFKVRFADKLGKNASIKLMTDGILLAEIQSDPMLHAYDTLIIDEAHERSLNIDFLLGYLRQLLPRRPDLKVIITSATIDAERFARHFASGGKPAPVIMVSGRLYPVEIRYRPFEESREYDLNHAIAEGVDELWRNPREGGDILVFLPGEREIREAADHLRKHAASRSAQFGPVEVLPLFSRLSPQEQERIFHPTGSRRVVLSTNVAETSLTVPGIHYVIDSGLARIKRYSYRNKVEQLLIEPVSQAAANQRAGRSGRVADGVCIRLYDEAEFKARPAYTDPEILRSSLASVILRMTALSLGAVEEFPFVEPPTSRAIADGYALLAELGAIRDESETDAQNSYRKTLTSVGEVLARLPLDPRIGRMILDAHDRHALTEVLVVASAMSVQDVRDRPLDLQQKADEKHKPFDDERSEFMGTLKLWQWLEQLRGRNLFESTLYAAEDKPALQEASHAALQRMGSQTDGHDGQRAGIKPARKAVNKSSNKNVAKKVASDTHSAVQAMPRLSNRQQEQRMREQFINVRRVREWRDIHTQLLTVVREHGWRLNTRPATYEQLHMALLAGLLGNIGCKSDEEDWYLGARGIKFWPHPGANLSKKPGRWVMASELVETSRLFGRGLANIQAAWVEQVGKHLLRTQLIDPHWEKKAAEVVALERATLYGLVIYSNRKVNYGKVDAAASREIFIREALVAGDWQTKLPFFAHNRKMIAQVQLLEHKARRQDLLVDDELIYAFYDQQLPPDVVSGHTFEQWYRREIRKQPQLLFLSKEDLMRHEAAGITTDAYPRTVRLGGIDCTVSYLHEPGHVRDGMTVTVPIYALNKVSEARCEWLVPGMLAEKLTVMLKSLHQRPRSRLMPLADFIQSFIQTHPFGEGGLFETLLAAVREKTQIDVKRTDFRMENWPPHVFMYFVVIDENGRQLGTGRNLQSLKAEFGKLARNAFQALVALKLSNSGQSTDTADGDWAKTSKEQTVSSDAKQILRLNSDKSLPQTTVSRAPSAGDATRRYTQWDFGVLPELMEIRKGAQTLIGFPALIDEGDAVHIEVFDEPEVAAGHHRAGLRRLVALQIKDALKYLEKNIPDMQRMGMQYMLLGSTEDLRDQIIALALDRAFLSEPLPTDAAGFDAVVEQGRTRLQLIAQEIARLTSTVLTEYTAAARKLKESKVDKATHDDVAAQLARLVSKRFVLETPWSQLHHVPRYLKAVVLRLDKYRSDRTRDEARMAELRPIEQRYIRRVAELHGKADARLRDYRWMLEELRVSLFAQELRTPYPVSVKRLEKVWAQMVHG